MKANYIMNEVKIMNDNTMEYLQDKIIESLIKKEDEIFINSVRNFAIPPLKGKITKGKLKRRDIELRITKEGMETKKQLFQRGNPISPVISMPSPLNIFSK